MRLPYLARLVCAALGGALGIIGAGALCTISDRLEGQRRTRRRNGHRDAELLAAMHRRPASGQTVNSEVEYETTARKFRRAS